MWALPGQQQRKGTGSLLETSCLELPSHDRDLLRKGFDLGWKRPASRGELHER